MKKARAFLKVFIFVQLGTCLGRFLWQYIDYKRNPVLYEINSAPWYTGPLVTAALTAVTVTLTLAAYLILGAVIRKREREAGRNSEEP